MLTALTELDQMTPEWLTRSLRRSGVLDGGRVVHVGQHPVNASSQVAHLAVQYSSDVPNNAPIHFLLKLADPELEQRMPRRNAREIAFYRLLAGSADLPVPRCYDACYETGPPDRFHLLLEDPSITTHIAQPHSVVPPTFSQCQAIVDTLALLHARCWDAPSLQGLFMEPHPAEAHTGWVSEQLIAWSARVLPRFLEDVGDRISEPRRALYRGVAKALPQRLLARQAERRNLTLTHGDVHGGNFLYPRDSRAHRMIAVDWKRAAAGLGASDLAYMMALHWFPEVRARREQALLRRYHYRLGEYGVMGYTWDDLVQDYHLAVLKLLFEPIWGWSVRQNSGIWWNHLERITLAIQDLDCMTVLQTL